MEPQLTHKKTRTSMIFIVLCVAALALVGTWTNEQWITRQDPRAPFSRDVMAVLETPAHQNAHAFVRVQDTSYWMDRSHGSLTSPSHVTSQSAPVTLAGQAADKSKSRIDLAAQSMIYVDRQWVEVVSGLARFTGPLTVRVNGQDKALADNESLVVYQNREIGEMTPAVGTIQDLHDSSRVDFAWKTPVSGDAHLELARDPGFTTVLFSTAITSPTTASVDFNDRSPGAWYARLQSRAGEQDQTLSVTSFNLVESETPDQLRRLGRRWITWRDRGFASSYRVEFSHSENFQKIDQSIETRNRELDLTRITAGSYFVRVVSTDVRDREFASRPIALQVQDKSEILRAGLELNDPELRLLAKGWKIHLTHDEVSRIREGYVILRESELRGIRADDSLKELLKNRDALIFEISRDEAFTNPERVRPDSRGELLPPALPLGTLHARLRRVESDGTLGAYGPSSRLTTWLPAPLTSKPKKTLVQSEPGVEISWNLKTPVAGYELRLSPDRTFETAATRTIRTRALSRKIATRGLDGFFWTVTAINNEGQPISLTSPVQEVNGLKPVAVKKTRSLTKSEAPREPAMIEPSIPVLQGPDEDAVIVGGATATKYGKLTWRLPGAKNSDSFEVQISTDGDFVNVIEKGKTKKPEFTLQGDLPEGALFWRVKKAKTDEWSRSRRFELVYE